MYYMKWMISNNLNRQRLTIKSRQCILVRYTISIKPKIDDVYFVLCNGDDNDDMLVTWRTCHALCASVVILNSRISADLLQHVSVNAFCVAEIITVDVCLVKLNAPKSWLVLLHFFLF